MSGTPHEEPLLDVSRTPPDNWKYLAEGGHNVIFAYCGPADPSFSGKVLRLQKIPHADPGLKQPRDVGTDTSSSSNDIGSGAAVFEKEFQDRIISQLIPPKFLQQISIAKLTSPWLESLKALCHDLRPIHRRDKAVIDSSELRGQLLPNLVQDGWVVEIKPKWGFLPNPRFIAKEHLNTKMKHCRYCMLNQRRKLNGQSSTSNFCALDLYSGSEERVTRALHALLNSWIASQGQITNLHIFVNGEKVQPGKDKGLQLLSDILNGNPNEGLVDRVVEKLLPRILQTGIFSVLARHQRLLDSLDIEGLSLFWKDINGNGVPIGSNLEEPTLEEWEQFIRKYSSPKQASEADSESDRRTPAVLQYFCTSYLMSAILKDCSVIFPFGGPGGTDSGPYVVDIGPKPIGRLEKWETLDREIVEEFRDGEERSCVE